MDAGRPLARISGEQVVALASALRKAVMARIPDPIPAQVSGHGAPGRPHLGFLALPDAGHDHADGHILGVALAIPRDLPPADLASWSGRSSWIRWPGCACRAASALALQYGADRYGLQPSRWAARSRGGSRAWVTATPLMLDGHLRGAGTRPARSRGPWSSRVTPGQLNVEVSAGAAGGGRGVAPAARHLPAGRPHRRLVHARVAFAEPVTGPGAGRVDALPRARPVPAGATPRRHATRPGTRGITGQTARSGGRLLSRRTGGTMTVDIRA